MGLDTFLIFILTGALILIFSLASLYGFLPEKYAIPLLFISSFFIGLGCISADPFLHGWDERFHALVAQNMLINPLRPTLFQEIPLSDINHDPWWGSHIWMHKGPVFSWLMGLCLKLFGNNLIAMRLSSLLMVLLISYSSYRSVRIFYPKVAFLIALILCVQPFLFLLASGRVGMDHNDIAFTAFISASFWAWTEFLTSAKRKWIIYIGLAASCAILTKWFAGTLIYFLWGLYILLFQIRSVTQWKYLLASILVCLLLTAPWFIYCYINFKEVLIREWTLNGASHLFEQLDGHITQWYFHFNIWYEYFKVSIILFLTGLITIFIMANQIAKRIATISLIAIILIMTLFSIAATRMPAYTIILASPMAFIAALGLERIRVIFANFKVLRIVGVLLIVIGISVQFHQKFTKHTPHETHANYHKTIRSFYADLATNIPERSVIYNTPQMQFVDVMFYTGRVAYEMVPTEDEVKETLAKGYEPILILDKTFTTADLKKLTYLKSIKTFQAPY